MRRLALALMIFLFSLIFSSCAPKVKRELRTFCIGASWEIPPAYNGNPWTPGGTTNLHWFIYEPLFYQIPATGEFIPRLAVDVKISQDRDIFTFKLRRGVRWNDGSKLTPMDVRTTLILAELHNLIPPIESFSISGDEITIKFSRKLDSSEVVRLLTLPINSPHHLYGAIAERAWKLMRERSRYTDEEYGKLKRKLLEELYRFRPDKPVGTGPFKLEKITASDAILRKWSGYWSSGKVQIDEIRAIRWPSNEVMWAALLAGEIDASNPATPYDVTQRILELNPHMKLVTPSDYREFGFIFNLRRPPMSDLNFRRAVAYLLNRDQIREITYYYADTVKGYNTGIVQSLRDRWLSDDFLRKLTKYDYDPEMAKKILERAGYKLDQEGYYMTPDGKPISIEIVVESGFTDWVLAAEIAASQLREAGIRAKVRPMEKALANTVMLSGKFDIAAKFTVEMTASVEPIDSYKMIYSGNGLIRQIAGIPAKWDSYDGKEYDLNALVEELKSASPERAREIVEHLAWITNEHLPFVSVYEKRLMVFVQDGVRVTGWPQRTDPIWSLSCRGIEQLYNLLIVTGRLRGVLVR